MKFIELHEHIPLARYGKEKSLTMEPYKSITLAMPGRHAEDTAPKGGDFVVMVTDPGIKWKRHQFKHSDLFHDVQSKYDHDPNLPIQLDLLMRNYLDVIAGGSDPKTQVLPVGLPGLDALVFLHAVQCLAVAEHRRYGEHEKNFGGRFLPFRFTAGIAQGLWTADDGTLVQRYGRSAAERLEKANGVPTLTRTLMGLDTLTAV